MYRTWTASDNSLDELARAVENHLNEHAGDVVSVGYAVCNGTHNALLVYRQIEISEERPIEIAVSIAESIVEEAQA